MRGSLILRSKQPFVPELPRTYSIGAFTITDRSTGRPRSISFDWDEGSSYAAKDEEGRLVMESDLKDFSEDFEEGNALDGVDPSEVTAQLLTQGELEEVNYECSMDPDAQDRAQDIDMELVSFSIQEGIKEFAFTLEQIENYNQLIHAHENV